MLLHIITEKGRGYLPAESASDKMHGVGQYDPVTGKPPAGPKGAPKGKPKVRQDYASRLHLNYARLASLLRACRLATAQTKLCLAEVWQN